MIPSSASTDEQPSRHVRSQPRSRARVAMFINSLQRGGAETQFLGVAAALRAAHCDVEIYVLLAGNDFADQPGTARVHLLSSRPGPETVVNAIRSMRASRPDVVLSFLYQATMVARLAARAAGVRVVVSSMRNERLETRGRELLYRRTGRLDRVTVVNSRIAAKALTARKVIRPGALRVIPNGVDLEPYDRADAAVLSDSGSAALRRQLGIAPGLFFFLGMGRLVPQKDWATLVAAVGRYHGPPAHWAIAGDGPGELALRAQIDAAGLGDRISLLGLRDDTVELLAACDALVLSSRYEGMPNVILEAMAAGRPVVATSVGGCPELIGVDFGTLVPPGGPQELAEAMAVLAARDPAQRKAMGVASRQHVRANYSLEVANERWAELINGLLGRSTAREPEGL